MEQLSAGELTFYRGQHELVSVGQTDGEVRALVLWRMPVLDDDGFPDLGFSAGS